MEGGIGFEDLEHSQRCMAYHRESATQGDCLGGILDDVQGKQDMLHGECWGQRGRCRRDSTIGRHQEDWCGTAMSDLLRHFSRGSFCGWSSALRTHHDEIHVGCKINNTVSRMTLTYKLLHG